VAVNGRLDTRALIWTVPAASLVHHAEEVLFSRSYFPLSQEYLDWLPAPLRLLVPTSQSRLAAWAAFETGVATAISALAAREEPPRLLTRVFGVTLVLDVLDVVDHTATYISRLGYNPGLVTAWVVRLPLSTWTLVRLLDDGRLDLRWLRRVVRLTAPAGGFVLAMAFVSRFLGRLAHRGSGSFDEATIG
jgi:hypothetical protein